MKSLLLMISFFTTIPVRSSHIYKEEDYRKAIKFIPIVGLIIGGLIYLPSLLDKYLDRSVLVLLVWTTYLIITGGLHIDGLADTADGIFSRRGKEEALQIMRDSRIGVFGAISVFWLLLCNLILSYYMENKLFIILPILGRLSAIVAVSVSKYARQEGGMGSSFIDNCGRSQALAAIMFSLILGVLTQGGYIIIPFIASLVSLIIITKRIEKSLGGMTGDTIGAVIEISQTLFMFFTLLTTNYLKYYL